MSTWKLTEHLKSRINWGSVCGSVGRAVASNNRGSRFESRPAKFILNFCNEKKKIKEKEAMPEMALFKKIRHQNLAVILQQFYNCKHNFEIVLVPGWLQLNWKESCKLRPTGWMRKVFLFSSKRWLRNWLQKQNRWYCLIRMSHQNVPNPLENFSIQPP